MPTPPTPPPGAPKRPTPKIHLDWKEWLTYLEASDAPEDQKRELIEIVWNIVIGFVDYKWDVGDNSEICGQDIDLTAVLTAAVIDSETRQKEKEEV